MKAPPNRIIVVTKSKASATQTASGLYIPPTADNDQITVGIATSVGSGVEGVTEGEAVHFNRLSVFKLKETPATYSLTPGDVLALGE